MSSTMTQTGSRRTVTAFFDRRADADAAVERLVGLGLSRSAVRVVAGSEQSGSATGSASVTGQSHNDMGFWEALKDLLLPDDDRATYAEGLRRGGYLVTVQTDSTYYDRVLDILDDEGTVDIDQRSQSWRSEGWTGHQATGAAAGLTGASVGSSQSRSTSTTGTGQGLTAGREEVIPVAEEQLRVGKREVSHGRVRIRSYVVETPVQEQVGLREEHVQVERRPVDRAVTGSENLFQDRTIVAEERAEEAVIAKEARVKEELVIRKEADQRTQTVSDTVRRTEVEVEDERGRSTGGKTTTTDRKVS